MTNTSNNREELTRKEQVLMEVAGKTLEELERKHNFDHTELHKELLAAARRIKKDTTFARRSNKKGRREVVR